MSKTQQNDTDDVDVEAHIREQYDTMVVRTGAKSGKKIHIPNENGDAACESLDPGEGHEKAMGIVPKGYWPVCKKCAQTIRGEGRFAWTEQDCIENLREFVEKEGYSPTLYEWRMKDYSPSVATIKRYFGSWNEAKEEAGLELYDEAGNPHTDSTRR